MGVPYFLLQFRPQFHPVSYMGVKRYLKAKFVALVSLHLIFFLDLLYSFKDMSYFPVLNRIITADDTNLGRIHAIFILNT